MKEAERVKSPPRSRFYRRWAGVINAAPYNAVVAAAPLVEHLGAYPRPLRRAIALRWGLEWPEREHVPSAAELAAAILASGRLAEVLSSLSPGARRALDALRQAGGELPAPAFEAQHGAARLLGEARLERERPWSQEGLSPAEELWYSGLLYRRAGPRGASYVLPQDLREPLGVEIPGPRALTPVDPPRSSRGLSGGEVVDPFFRLLVGMARSSGPLRRLARQAAGDAGRAAFVVLVALEAGLLRRTEGGAGPGPRLSAWLHGSPARQAHLLRMAWAESRVWDDLCQLPGLDCPQGWSHDPRPPRRAVLSLLTTLPPAVWFSVEGWRRMVKAQRPGFLRSAADFAEWRLRAAGGGQLLQGFESWERVEGALLGYLLEGPLLWLGVTQTGQDCFALTADGASYLRGQAPSASGRSSGPALVVSPRLEVILTPQATLYHRFRLELAGELGAGGRYRISRASLARYLATGRRLPALLRFLELAAGRPLPREARARLVSYAGAGRRRGRAARPGNRRR